MLLNFNFFRFLIKLIKVLKLLIVRDSGDIVYMDIRSCKVWNSIGCEICDWDPEFRDSTSYHKTIQGSILSFGIS